MYLYWNTCARGTLAREAFFRDVLAAGASHARYQPYVDSPDQWYCEAYRKADLAEVPLLYMAGGNRDMYIGDRLSAVMMWDFSAEDDPQKYTVVA